MTLRVFVLDDEPLAVARLLDLLAADERVGRVASSTDPEAACARLQEDPVDLVLLDIEMPVLDGLGVARMLPPESSVVFTTAHESYALRAFRVCAVDYLLKPVRATELSDAVGRVLRLRSRPSEPATTAGWIERLRDAIESGAAARAERIASRLGDRVQLLDLADISHFRADGKLTYAVVNGKTHVVDASMNELETRLGARFFRVHRASLVQLSYVHEVFAWLGGGLRLRLRDGSRSEIPVARDRARALKAALSIR